MAVDAPGALFNTRLVTHDGRDVIFIGQRKTSSDPLHAENMATLYAKALKAEIPDPGRAAGVERE